MSQPESKIVEAVAIASVPISTLSGKPDPNRIRLSSLVEKAMSDAVLECMHDGITDPDEQKKAMMAARVRVIDQYRAAEAKAIAEMEEAKAKQGNEPEED